MSTIETPSGRYTIPARRYDCVIIGGGVNGAGVFRDLALRGLKVCLFEKEDFGAGTSGSSSAMIHGGLRYILSEPSVTKESCKDSGIIRKIASHLVFRIPFIYPVVKTRKMAPLLLLGMDAVLFGYDIYSRLKGGVKHMLFTAEEIKRIEPGLSSDVIGGVSFDEWGIDPNRLCYLLVKSGEYANGKAFNHSKVEAIDYIPPGEGREGFFVLKVNKVLERRTERVESRTVVNAGGPWGPDVAGMAGFTYKLRPAKGIHLVLERRIVNFAVVSQAPDGREIFIEPWQNVTLIGTTDDDYYGNLDNIPVSHDEVQYLLEGMERVLPGIRNCRIISTWAGVRPTLYEYGKNEDKLSRDYRIYNHADNGIRGMWSIAGGKLSSFRQMAEETADNVCRFLGVQAVCRTGEIPLPGSEEVSDVKSLSIHWSVDAYVLSRMVSRHGSMARKILVNMLKFPQSRSLVCRCEPVTEAEIRYVIANEKVYTLTDLMRRTRLGTGPCGGIRCAFRAAAILGKYLDWSSEQIKKEASTFIEYLYSKRRAVIRGSQSQQEVLIRMHLT